MENNPVNDVFAHINVIYRLLTHLYCREYGQTLPTLHGVQNQILATLQKPLPSLENVPLEELEDIHQRAVRIANNFFQNIYYLMEQKD